MTSNTYFNNGIEFVLPGIYKAYRREWAEQFLENGIIYFTNIEIFKYDKNVERGDSLEGSSVTIRQGVKCTADYLNPIFVFCSTMETDPDIILNTWNDRDTVLQITDTLTFINRIKDAAIKMEGEIIGMQVGPVTYDKDTGSYREYHWAEGIFQKNYKYNSQKEFRLALTGTPGLKKEHLCFELGSCKNIARIIKT